MTSFNVTWKSDSKLTGKVYAKKRKLKTDKKVSSGSQQTLVDSQKKFEDKVTVKHEQMNKKVLQQNAIKNLQQNSDHAILGGNFKKTSKLVKRKQKKIRLLAKLAADSERQSPIQPQKQKEHSLFSVGNKDIYIKPNASGKSVVEEVFSTDKKFADLNIHKYIVSNLEKIGFTTLTNVQEKSIPVILNGKNVLVSMFKNIKSFD